MTNSNTVKKRQGKTGNKPLTIKIFFSSMESLASFLDVISTDAGPACLFKYATMPSASRGPLYSCTDSPPFLRILRVGNPRTSYFEASSLFASSFASNFAKVMAGSWPLKTEAAFSY